ncbi:MAG TPA: hypothetical protein DCR04_04275 [Flavobacteriales bacterium]|nr:hypothetical protein [Flavobacteriales bacterium]
MNLLIRIVLIVVLSAVAQTYFPWWSAVVVALIVETVLGKGSNSTSFFSGFYGLAIPWMVLALYIDNKSESVLSIRILELFQLPQFRVVIIVLTGLVGGLVGGLGSVAGGWIKDAFLQSDGK